MRIRTDPASWKDRRHRLGVDGEELAKEFLRRRGWQILDHRFTMGRLEIDLVARLGTIVAFVEVKTRLSRTFGSPLEAVTRSKQRDIARVAQAWIDRHRRPHDVYRFDVIGIERIRRGHLRVVHVEDAFKAGWR